MPSEVEPLRVVQWTTGNVGRRALRAMLRNPHLDVIGCFAWSEAKVGRDLGELAAVEPTGVTATNDVDALLGLAPDCVSYNPIWPDVDEMCRILGSGSNICSTAGFVTGRALGADALARLEAAARTGSSTVFGTGINPGFANLFALVSAGICDRVERITVLESADATGYASADTQLSVGFAHDPDAPATATMTEAGSAVFGDAVAMMGDALGVELESIAFEVEYARATQTMDLGFIEIPEGTVAGISACWFGTVEERRLVECRVQWKMGEHMEPDWHLRHGYFVDIDGEPRVRSQLQILPPKDWSENDFMGLGMIMTAMPAVNAIPAVCAAPPGVVTHRDLPLVTAAGFAGG